MIPPIQTVTVTCPKCRITIPAELFQCEDEQVFWTTEHCGLEISMSATMIVREPDA